jgi:hypothetical protein
VKEKPQGDLLHEFEKRIFEKRKISKGEQFVQTVFDYSKLYDQIFIDKTFIDSDHSDHNYFASLIGIMDREFKASEWRAAILAYAKTFNTDRFFDFCLNVERLYLKHWFTGTRKDERFKDYARFLNAIASNKTSSSVVKNTIEDVKPLHNYLTVKDMYRSGYGKYVLLRLELLEGELDNAQQFQARSVEHVLPQNPKADSYWGQHHDLSRIEDYVDTLGNLVLLSKGKNSASSNRDFKEKKAKYLESRVTGYPRSVKVLGYDEWLEKTIVSRSEAAAKLFFNDLRPKKVSKSRRKAKSARKSK